MSIPALVKLNGQLVSLATLSTPVEALTFSQLSTVAGTWTWFNDPRAVVHAGVLYTGFVKPVDSANADIYISALNLDTGDYSEQQVKANISADDHASPAIFIRPSDERIIVFYEAHNDSVARLKISTNPLDISAFGTEQTFNASYASYSNPLYLSSEDRLYYLMRIDAGGGNWRPGVAWSDDIDAATPTWSAQHQTFNSGVADRPYWAYACNDVDRIDFVYSSGHPQGVSAGQCHIFHFYLQGGNFHKTDGTLIRAFSTLTTTGAITNTEATKVYDATANKGDQINGNAWPWGVEYDPDGNPVITFSSFSAIDDNRYWYARWTGSAWERHEIASGQGSLYGPGDQAEDQYVGGLRVDPRNTNRLYVSVQVDGTTWKMERWTTADGGSTWTTETIAEDAGVKYFRPYVPRGWVSGAPAIVFPGGDYTQNSPPASNVAIYRHPAAS